MIVLLALAGLSWMVRVANLLQVAGRHVNGDAAVGQGIGVGHTVIFAVLMAGMPS